MPTHAEQRILPYTPEQLFDLVADVERYPEFLPWCTRCRITRRIKPDQADQAEIIHADLTIGYKFIRETFSSRVTLNRPDHIHVEYLQGPMKNLSNHWRFIETEEGCCTIDFYVEFEFKNPFLKGLIDLFFNEAVRRMVGAFKARAKQLYG